MEFVVDLSAVRRSNEELKMSTFFLFSLFRWLCVFFFAAFLSVYVLMIAP